MSKIQIAIRSLVEQFNDTPVFLPTVKTQREVKKDTSWKRQRMCQFR